ncbi:MAG: FAD-dependent monooxygenase [Chloroflexi bacterium]|nr:FAD-dependent monooxygenase [Chloroflexota bacterium]
MNGNNRHAIVLGGSIAGLLAARVLTEHFEQVTLIERDALPTGAEPRKGVPQGRHLHALLARGYQALVALFPGFKTDLLEAGAVISDLSNDVRWYQGGYSVNFNSGIEAVFISRPTLEWLIRQRVVALPNLALRPSCAVTALTTTADQQQVTGVMIHDRQTNEDETVTADLVVDATGRGSHIPKWLTQLGYATPEESTVNVGVSYATRLYRRTVSDDQAKALLNVPVAPLEKRGGGVFPIEHNGWLATLTGYQDDEAPKDEQGFLAHAHSLPAQEIYELLKNAEPLSDIATYNYPASRRRHYEQLTRFPIGLITVGDAVCSFNPIYGQGMTVCALEALVLDKWLRSATQQNQPRDSRQFFTLIAKVIDVPWALAKGADTVKASPNLLDRYLNRLKKVSQHDKVVSLAFIKVVQLLAPPASLFHPRIVLRVLLGSWRRDQAKRSLKTAWRTV